MNKIIVIKLGGSVLGSRDTSLEDVARLKKEGYFPVVVHGGAATVNTWLKRLNITPSIVQGERVTDKETLEVVAAVLAGLVNKETTAMLLDLGVKAVGLSGVDGALIHGTPRGADWGYMGDVRKVDLALLKTLLENGFVPVVSPVSLNVPGDPVRLLNINGDPIAGELAASLKADRLIFLTDVSGIKDAAGIIVKSAKVSEAEALVTSKIATGGMVPKIRAAVRAAAGGTVTSIVDGRQPNIIYNEAIVGGLGTSISA
ncbi:acetylglutamate kinase [Dehalogenimonas etheniformans]|uniref:Acetylglutamate kinase n=1 Tax=Dehalogenimonas etheniformans TaxID=1536648 RepID=A0A2P5P5U4_9CHLR|nr:acetylglutamate kinase [Dehalogenimonas etheniformans]PPD57664.1 acetylglutamate kinase [Dehalogenimonas etheniformans]QNT76006.1 acetylglutamate kinase [Dehalogenimonas etheniformans]